MINQFENTMPDFNASPLVDALEENLFSVLEKLAAQVNTPDLPLIDLSSGSPDQPTPLDRLSASGDPAA